LNYAVIEIPVIYNLKAYKKFYMKKKLLLVCLTAFYCINLYSQNTCHACFAGRDSAYNPHISHHFQHNRNVGNGNPFSTTPIYIDQNVCGLNWTYFSQLTETRTQTYSFNTNGSGFPAVVNVPNIPCGGFGGILKAYAYWDASYTEASAPTTTISITDPSNNTATYASTIIGTGPSTCWPTNGTANYRADVTPSITGSGNYSINLTGFQNVGYEVDGVSVVIIYASPTATYSGSFALWDGCIVAIGGSETSVDQGFTVCAATNNAQAFGIFADIQSNVNGNQNTDDFNGNIVTFTNDFWNVNVIPTTLTNGQNSLNYEAYTNNGGDCWAWVANGLYWQNTTCVVCTPPSTMTVTITSGNPICGNLNGWVTANVAGGTAPYTYNWSNGGTLNTISGLSAGSYSVVIIDNSGCDTVRDSVTLVTSTVLVTPTLVNVLCNGQCTGSISIAASGGAPPYTYAWLPVNAGTGSSASSLCAGIYTVSTEDNNGCTTIDTLTITQPPALTIATATTGVSCNGGTDGTATATVGGGTPGYAYLWNNGQTNTTSTNLTAGTYTVTATDINGCSITSTATVTQPAQLQVSASGPQTICVGQAGALTATVTGGTAPYAYLWSTGATTSQDTIRPTSTASYTVVVTDANGCTASASIIVTLGPALNVGITGIHSICKGRSISICAATSGGTGGNTYLWQPGNITGPCISVTPDSSVTYTVYVRDNCGTVENASALVPVNPLPAVAFSADLYQGCAPLCIQFRNKTTVRSGGLESYAWTFGNGDSSLAEDPIYCYPDTGKYSISLTTVSDSGCSATLNIYNLITVYSHPKSQFTVSPQPTDILNADIQFTDATTDTYGIAYWWWNFGDGADSNSTLENPTHTYQDTGTYCPQLVTMNNHGCTDTITNCLVISPIFTIYIPDAFTPNGDGKNEVFTAKGQYISSFEMYIFDRWGSELYHTTDINKGWDGTMKGGSTICQNDTYVYKILVTDSKNKQHNFVGAVNLLK
jgi:gliding motility-associated-like protein